MTTIWRSAITLLVLAAPAWADPVFTADATEACLATLDDGGDPGTCVGKSAEVCYSPPGVYSNVAIGFCLRQEANYWDDRLNAAYRALRTAERAIMDDMVELGATVPDTAAALQEMQRAWILFRDTSCGYEYATFGNGTGGGPAHAACTMTMTARQTFVLERYASDRGGLSR